MVQPHILRKMSLNHEHLPSFLPSLLPSFPPSFPPSLLPFFLPSADGKEPEWHSLAHPTEKKYKPEV